MEVNTLIKEILGKDAKIVEQQKGGMMNESYIVSCKDKKYIIFIPTQQANEMVNRFLERETQDIAWHLKLTSKNVYFDVETGVKMHEFIEGYSLNHVEDPEVNRVAGLLKYFHNSPTHATMDYNPFPRLASFEREARQFTRKIPSNYELLRNVINQEKSFLEKQEKCLCHNDAQKSNIVKELSTGKYYLIDFEFAANNDPIYDIATYGNGKVSEGRELLDAYYGKPTKEEIKRYYLWRIFISLQWHTVAIIKHYRGEGVRHGFNFLEVANFFLANGMDAYNGYKKECK